jgi:hypothetical protein
VGASQVSTFTRSAEASDTQPAVARPATITCRKMPLPRAGVAGTGGVF